MNWELLERVVISWKYLGFVVFCALGWILLSRNRAFKRSRIGLQLGAFLLYGGVLTLLFGWIAPTPEVAEGAERSGATWWLAVNFGLHPSPMCAVSKGAYVGFIRSILPIPMVTLILVALVTTLIGGKGFCGFACPLGALQELVGRIRGPRKVRLPFRWTNGFRIAAFAAFFVVLFAARELTYDYFNPFELLHWSSLTHPLVWIPAAVVLVASLFLYRPFCAVVCPMGLLTWTLERVSFGRIRVDQAACNDCNRCTKDINCQALPALVSGARVVPDCHGCGDCLSSCPTSAIRFAWGRDASSAAGGGAVGKERERPEREPVTIDS